MSIVCSCTACDTKFKADAKYAGRKVRCPKCRTTIQLPGAPDDAKSARPLPVKVTANAANSPEAPPIKPPENPTPTVSEEMPTVSIDDSSGRDRNSASRPRKGMPIWFVVLAGGSILVLGCGGLLTWGALSFFKNSTVAESLPTQIPTAATLKLDWPEADRRDATLRIDGDEVALPAGELQFELDEGTHDLLIQRRGYEQIEVALSLKPGDEHHYTPTWEPLSLAMNAVADAATISPTGFDGWLQDLQVARNRCKEEHKRLLIVFGCSDADAETERLARETLSQESVREYTDEHFQCVIIDFPQTRDGIALVDDFGQNTFLRDHYSVATLPTIVLADEEGVPYARIEDAPASAAEFVQTLETLADDHDERDRLLQATREGTAEERFAASLQAARWLEQRSALTFYETDLNTWMTLAESVDPTNDEGQHEILFEFYWLVRLDQTNANVGDDLLPVIQLLNKWHQKHRFQDHDRAARLHLLGAALLTRLDHVESAAELIEASRDYQPKNAKLADQMREASKFMAARDQLSSATGFVVDASGLILTNNHVVAAAGRTTVRVRDSIPPLAAELVDRDESRDLALLKIPVPDGVTLHPIPIASATPNRGAEIAAFGYPLGDALGSVLKLTTGVVSSLPDESNDRMLLLDLTINPGNSGGPICNGHGHVVGIVTAKSFAGDGLDSYGMAIPASDVLTFLKKHLPSYEPASAPEDEQPRRWEQVDQAVSPGVLHVLKLK